MSLHSIFGLSPLFPPSIISRLRAARIEKENPMFTTIQVAGQITAQGLKVADHLDGRVTIETGRERVTGWPIPKLLRGAVSALALALLGFGAAPQAQAEALLNVSYDPTRELYREFNEAFTAHWQAEGNAAPSI